MIERSELAIDLATSALFLDSSLYQMCYVWADQQFVFFDNKSRNDTLRSVGLWSAQVF